MVLRFYSKEIEVRARQRPPCDSSAFMLRSILGPAFSLMAGNMTQEGFCAVVLNALPFGENLTASSKVPSRRPRPKLLDGRL